MVKIDRIYKSDLVSVVLLSTEYEEDYRETDYNPLPAISFPIMAGYRYRSGNFDRIVDTDTVLIERGDKEFEVAKFGEFAGDVTLSFQFPESGFGLFEEMVAWNITADIFHRTPQAETLIRLFLSTYLKNCRLQNDELIDHLLFRNLSAQKAPTIKAGGIKPWLNKKIDAAKDYIHCHSAEDISLADISAASNISAFHFSRIFKQKTGYTPYDYLLQVRIEKARQLLSNEASVTSTAFDVGFNSVENFSYSFKKNTGLSPSQYKSMLKFS